MSASTTRNQTGTRPPKPTPPPPVDPRTIPALAWLTAPEHKRWVGWKFEWVPGKDGKEGRWTKPPFAITGRKAHNDKPATWSTFDEVWPLVLDGMFDGIGLELLDLPGDEFAAIDLDDVRDPDTGAVLPWAAAIAAQSLTEITPSQSGVRTLGTVRGFDTVVHRRFSHPEGGSFELYVHATRYITVSGHLLDPSVCKLADITAEMTALLALCDAKPDQPKPNGADGGTVHSLWEAVSTGADLVELETLPAHIYELLTEGTLDGKPVDRSVQFMRVVRYLWRRFSFAAVLDAMKAYPRGVQSKYWRADGKLLERELKRAWGKMDDPRPSVRVLAGKRHEAADAGLAALKAAGVAFYQRDKGLVRIARIKAKASDNKAVLVPAVMPVSVVMLGRALGQSTRWEKIKATGEVVAIDPPKEVVEQIAAMTDEWPFPALRGVIDTPTLRPDGSLLQTPGYDEATGYVLFNPPPMPAIPERPSKDDAQAGLLLLDGLLFEFPFTNAASLSVARSMLMTPVLRAAMSVAPAHVSTAPTAGTGKSYLADTASAIAVGDRCAVLAISEKADETEKRLIGAALAQHPIIAIDNCNALLMGDFLCQATERPMMQIRPLSTSNMVRISNTFTVLANGNNLTIGADNVRRCVQCALDANMESPEKRTFSANPVDLVLADRGKYVAAILTIARAYIVAGKPGRLPPHASYEAWSDLVRSALVWLGCADPVDTVANIRAEDPVRQQQAAVFDAWQSELTTGNSRGYLTSELIDATKEWNHTRGERERPKLWDALMDVAASQNRTLQEIDSRRLGRWLGRNVNTVMGGWKLTRDTGDEKRPRWALKAVRP